MSRRSNRCPLSTPLASAGLRCGASQVVRCDVGKSGFLRTPGDDDEVGTLREGLAPVETAWSSSARDAQYLSAQDGVGAVDGAGRGLLVGG